jgi:hypothetical protein
VPCREHGDHRARALCTCIPWYALLLLSRTTCQLGTIVMGSPQPCPHGVVVRALEQEEERVVANEHHHQELWSHSTVTVQCRACQALNYYLA